MAKFRTFAFREKPARVETVTIKIAQGRFQLRCLAGLCSLVCRSF